MNDKRFWHKPFVRDEETDRFAGIAFNSSENIISIVFFYLFVECISQLEKNVCMKAHKK